MAIVKRDEFVNQSQGYIGVIRLDKAMNERPEAVEPFGHVFLSKDEQELTAQAHQDPASNPFLDHLIIHYDLKTMDEIRRINGPILLRLSGKRATGAAQEAAGEAPRGTSDDEVGNPEAPTLAKA